MQLRLRTLMLAVALLAVGLAAPDPPLALALIFTCPLWFVLWASRRPRSQDAPAD